MIYESLDGGETVMKDHLVLIYRKKIIKEQITIKFIRMRLIKESTIKGYRTNNLLRNR